MNNDKDPILMSLIKCFVEKKKRQSSRNCGSPYSGELQLSSFLEIKAWIKITVSDFDRQFLILTILRK